MGSKIVSNINDVMEAQKVTQADLARRLDWHQPQLSRYLSGAVPIPVDKLEAILEELKISVFEKDETHALRLALIAAILKIPKENLPVIRKLIVELSPEAVDIAAQS